MYTPLILTLHLWATFFVLARVAVWSPEAFRAVRVAILVVAVFSAWSTPLVALLLIIPVVAANQLRFIRIPDVLDVTALQEQR